MSSPAMIPPRCSRCGTTLHAGLPCGLCEQPLAAQSAVPAPYPAPTYVVQTPKSAGIAVLLSLLVLGGGHLYLNRIGVGIALVCWDVFLFLVFLVPIVGWVIGFVLWVVSFGIVAAVVVAEANTQNRALYGKLR